MKFLSFLTLLTLSLTAFASDLESIGKSKNIEIFNDKLRITEFRLQNSPSPDGPIHFPEDKALALSPALKTKITFRS